jgi:hypothetical protein
MRLAGHVAVKGDEKSACKSSVRISEEKKPTGRPRYERENNTEMVLNLLKPSGYHMYHTL